jgi:hypothetical protein
MIMAFMIYRAGDLHNSPPSQGRPGKRGILNIGKSAFYDVIEPKLERVNLTAHAVGYTDRSVERVIAEGIAEAAAERDRKPQPRRRRRVTEESATA